MGRVRDLTTQVHRIYMTAEVDAWSRDFNYEGYVDLKQKRGDHSKVLSPKGYSMLCDMMQYEVYDDR
jgi:hypothetical protein